MTDIGRWRLISEETPDKPPPEGIFGIELWYADLTLNGICCVMNWRGNGWGGGVKGGFNRYTQLPEVLECAQFTHWRYFVTPNYKEPTADA